MFSPQSQRSLRESQGALLEKVEELTEQLKQERQRALALEGQLNTATLSLQTLDKVRHLNTCTQHTGSERGRGLLFALVSEGILI